MNDEDKDSMIKLLLERIQKVQMENEDLESQIEELQEQIENLESVEFSNKPISLSQFRQGKSIEQLLSELSVFNNRNGIRPKNRKLIDTAIDKIFEYCELDPRFAPRHNWRNH